jgi:hypothetical protein
MLYLAKPGLKLSSKPMSICQSSFSALSPTCLPFPRGASLWEQKEVSTQHARCWIGCYFSRPSGPNPAQGGVGGTLGTGHAGLGEGQNFLYFIHLQLGHQ